MKKILSLLVLAFVVCLFPVGCFGTSEKTLDPQTPTTSEQVVTTIDDVVNVSISKTSDISTESSYDLKPLLSFLNGKTIADFDFYTNNAEVATVTSNGVINRVSYGQATIYVIPKGLDPNDFAVQLISKTFKITFNTPIETYAGTFKAKLPQVEGKTQIDFTIVIKADSTFTVTYTAGSTVYYDTEYEVSAQSASGTFTIDSIMKFTITSETTLKKTFSAGQFVRDANGNVTGFKIVVPVSDTAHVTVDVEKQ